MMIRTTTSSSSDYAAAYENGYAGGSTSSHHRQLSAQSIVFELSGQCSAKFCAEGDDQDVLHRLINEFEDLSFVSEVVAVNEFLTDSPSAAPSSEEDEHKQEEPPPPQPEDCSAGDDCNNVFKHDFQIRLYVELYGFPPKPDNEEAARRTLFLLRRRTSSSPHI